MSTIVSEGDKRYPVVESGRLTDRTLVPATGYVVIDGVERDSLFDMLVEGPFELDGQRCRWTSVSADPSGPRRRRIEYYVVE